MTYSIYRARLGDRDEKSLSLDELRQIWDTTVAENIFVICKTPMAKAITRRTLAGFRNSPVNAHYFDDLINYLRNKQEKFIERVLKKSYWKKGGGKMKFDAVVGNPPYQEETDGSGRQAKPIYQYFVKNAKKISSNYISLIIPSRWFAGGMGLDDFRNEMMHAKHIKKLVDYVNAKDCFPTSSISGGVCFFLIDKNYNGDCKFINVQNGKIDEIIRALDEFPVLVRYNKAISIIRKVIGNTEKFLPSMMSSLMPFGLNTNYRGVNKRISEEQLTLYASGDSITYINRNEISAGFDYVDKFKVMISKTSAEHAGEPSNEGNFKVLTSSMKVLKPNEVCTHSYFLTGFFEEQQSAENIICYLKTKFVRFLVLMSLTSINVSKLVFNFVPVQDFSRSWTDEDLYSKYGLSDEEINFIESTIKPM